ncbi:MAG TPA: lantibiotic dehydratase [Streptosporangiaceae bacterium]|nr:lantibiotic dehydratase [Streptosporangiaceae bacterium]
MDSRRIYHPTGPILARVSTYPGGPDVPADLDLHPGADPRSCASWLPRTWQDSQVQAAIWLANPDLADKITAVLASDPATLSSRGAAIRRIAIAMACYLLRWQHRPTPFGLFAGVTAASSGPAGAPADCR